MHASTTRVYTTSKDVGVGIDVDCMTRTGCMTRSEDVIWLTYAGIPAEA